MTNDQNLHPLADVSEQIRKRRERLSTKRGYLALLRNEALMVLLIVIAFTQIFTITTVRGTNMFPAILDGDILIGYRLDHKYIKNDVVICTVNGKEVVGRVVAKEGDSVNITEDGVLYVNGTEQTGEIAFATYPGQQEYPYVVPKGCIYLLGDFRTKTLDSRSFGAVPVQNVKAKVVNIIRRRGI